MKKGTKIYLAYIVLIFIAGSIFLVVALQQQKEKARQEAEVERIISEIKQTLKYKNEHLDIDVFCLEKTRSEWESLGWGNYYEDAYNATCLNNQKLDSGKLNPETFCTDQNRKFADLLGNSEWYKQTAAKICP